MFDQRAATGSASVSGRTERKPLVSWAALLDEPVKKPGFMHGPYCALVLEISLL